MNVVLIGLMGAGKTSIGRALAETLGYKFMDTDSMIEKEQGCSISDIFFYAGEEFHRTQETKVLHKLRGSKKIVLATGGGIIVTKGNIEILKDIGRVYYLNVTPELAYERVKTAKDRPLLKDVDDKLEKIKELLKAREALYREADVTIDVTNNQKHQVVNHIVQDLKQNSR